MEKYKINRVLAISIIFVIIARTLWITLIQLLQLKP